MEEYYRVYAKIDLSAVRDNVDALKKCTEPGTKVMAIVKANGYGHGDVAVSKAVYDKVDAFGVATAEEAVNLRKNGIDKDILILGYVMPPSVKELIANDIILTVFDIETAKCISKEAVSLGKTARCHIKMDTGMNRIGLKPVGESVEVIKEIKKLDSIDVCGIFTHFFASDEFDKTSANNQYEKFSGFLDACEKEGITFECRHCCNSAGTMEMPYANLDMVRIGIAMYGLYPSEEVDKKKALLKPLMELKSSVVMVKTIGPGEGISYGATFVSDKEMKVATVCVGYGDGYPRRLSNKGDVIIRGRRAPIIGRVCMDQMMVDVTDIPDVSRLDEVTLFGRDGDEFISMEEMCETAGGTFNYEMACDIGKRIPRRYIVDGKVVGMQDNFDEYWDIKF